mmetsp:Transcript_17877/g.24141  ORF Transcript_17877/g.24141 Transcript_17877/m.24141 type:complete len:265 (+) Transcript_17877:590-1384(+)
MRRISRSILGCSSLLSHSEDPSCRLVISFSKAGSDKSMMPFWKSKTFPTLTSSRSSSVGMAMQSVQRPRNSRNSTQLSVMNLYRFFISSHTIMRLRKKARRRSRIEMFMSPLLPSILTSLKRHIASSSPNRGFPATGFSMLYLSYKHLISDLWLVSMNSTASKYRRSVRKILGSVFDSSGMTSSVILRNFSRARLMSPSSSPYFSHDIRRTASRNSCRIRALSSFNSDWSDFLSSSKFTVTKICWISSTVRYSSMILVSWVNFM